jgi:DNA-directed RNA polymerase specialized sigma24 family protein
MTKRTAHAELIDRLGVDEADRLTQMFLEDLMTKREAAAELGMSLSVFEYRLSQGDTKHARLMSESVKPHGQPRWVVVREPIPGQPRTAREALGELLGPEEADRLVGLFLSELMLADEAAAIVGMPAKTLRADMYKGVVPYSRKLDPSAHKSPWVVLPDALPAIKKKREGR